VDDYVVPVGLWAPHALQVVHSAIVVKLDPGADVASGRAAVKQITAGYGQPSVDNRADFVKREGQAVTFLLGIVYVLLVLAIVIAVLGIANTLSLGIHERTHEIGLLRAVGQTRRQLRSMIRLESVIISLFGVVGGLGLGVFLGWALAEAADRAAGVATFTAPVAQLAVILALGGAAGVLAAIRPARRAARLPVLGAIATE
jgi:putative ABC transport system permease protein